MLLSPEELKKSAEMDPTIVEFTKVNPLVPVPWNDAQAVKDNMKALSAMTMDQIGAAEPAINESYMTIPMRDGFQSSVVVDKPTTPPTAGSPLIVLIFGGGWISGEKETMIPFGRALVRLFGAVVICISYRLAPEHKFPTSQNDCWDSVQWIAAHASELNADPTKGFLVGGVSAGGTNAAVCTTLSVEEKLNPPITGQWLCVPAIMFEQHVPEKYKKHFLAHEHNKNAPILPTWTLEALANHTSWDANSPLRSPILSKAPLSDLPPTFIQADGMDAIRDDALIYDEMLKEAGVQTRMRFYAGAPHAHFAFLPGLEISNRAVADVFQGFGWLLGKEELTQEDALKSMATAAA